MSPRNAHGKDSSEVVVLGNTADSEAAMDEADECESDATGLSVGGKSGDCMAGSLELSEYGPV